MDLQGLPLSWRIESESHLNLPQDLNSFLVSAIIAAAYTFAFFLACYAIWRARSPQGAIAWVISLLSLPFITIPLYLIFGRNRFYGYVRERKEWDATALSELKEIESLAALEVPAEGKMFELASIASCNGQIGFTSSNRIELLIDGTETFSSILKAMEQAERYIIFQFYIFREDKIGKEMAKLLKRKAKEGLRVYFLSDAIGTRLGRKFLGELTQAGVQVGNFRSTKSWGTRFQVNFRNHRKLVIVDGQVAFIGGHNVGDDYLGRWKTMGPWRDTHVRLEGPAAIAAQDSFIRDWYWVKEELPDLDWGGSFPRAAADTLVLHTGPADRRDACLLLHTALIGMALKRIWIANPYFVPPETLSRALELARLRGVDVRIIVPAYSDNKWIFSASKTYVESALKAGIRIFEYHAAFLHQKVMLIDQAVATVGSANLDERSMFLNFELTSVMLGEEIIADVEKMLAQDFKHSHELELSDLTHRPFIRRFTSRALSLLSPIL